jgi:hypothetical protein
MNLEKYNDFDKLQNVKNKFSQFIPERSVPWLLLDISEFLRNIGHRENIDLPEIISNMPIKYFLYSNSMPACEWVAEYLGYEYKSNIDEVDFFEEWVKKE